MKYEFVVKILELLLLVMSVLLMPTLRDFLKVITDFLVEKLGKEKANALMKYLSAGIKLAEKIFNEKGAGKDKKAYVKEFLKLMGVDNVSDEQVNSLIDMFVDWFNKQGWDKELPNLKE